MKRLVIVSELFYPEESATAHIMTRIALGMRHDYDVVVFAGPKSYEGESVRNSQGGNEEIHQRVERVWAPALTKNRIGPRIIRFVILSMGLAWKVFTETQSGDIILAVTNPAPMVLVLALIRKIKGISLVMLVHDIFPENAAAANILQEKSWVYTATKNMFDLAYATADSIIAIGRDMAEVLSRKAGVGGERIQVVENWADSSIADVTDREASRNLWNTGGRITILYAGNIGRTQGVLEFVDWIKTVENESLHYVFAGSGALSESLRAKVAGTANVTVAGAYSRSSQDSILESCDIALVILNERMYGLGVPSKAYNIMAAGRPLLFLGPRNSEIHRVVRENQIGWAFDWHQLEELRLFLQSISLRDRPDLRAIGRRAKQVATDCYTESTQMNKIRKVLQSQPTIGQTRGGEVSA